MGTRAPGEGSRARGGAGDASRSRPLPPRPRQALPAHGQAARSAGAPHHRDDHVPRDGHDVLAGEGGSGDEGSGVKSDRPRSVRSQTKAQLVEENERLRERLVRAEGPNRETRGTEEADRLRRELAKALEQQTATAEILRVISSSPTDYQPVFDTIVRTAGVVCGALDAMLWTVDGDELVVRAHHGPIAAAIGVRQPIHGSVAGYAVREARIVHVEDLTEAD